MTRIFLRHPVADYGAWRPHFDQDAPRRAEVGLTDVAVLRDADDPNSVWIVFDGDVARVEAMLQDPDLAKLMQEAGVTGPPEFWAT